jgi:hypothetical protein
VDYDADKWGRIEQEGLGGFTGIIPRKKHRAISIDVPGNGAYTPPISDPKRVWAPGMPMLHIKDEEWFDIDVSVGGDEMRSWAGVEYESEGGKEVGNMVRGLWDERGFETAWVNL